MVSHSQVSRSHVWFWTASLAAAMMSLGASAASAQQLSTTVCAKGAAIAPACNPANPVGDRAEGWAGQHRSEVMARNGIVTTSQPLAAEAGLEILKQGGNAVDAAVATAAVLGLVEPMNVGIGERPVRHHLHRQGSPIPCAQCERHGAERRDRRLHECPWLQIRPAQSWAGLGHAPCRHSHRHRARARCGAGRRCWTNTAP